MLTLEEPVTYWERVAVTRFGRYLTQIEEELVHHGIALAGPAGAAVEIGCEGGRWSQLLVQSGWTVTCTDIDPQSLEVCRQRLPACRCILVDAADTTLPCSSASAQLLLCIEVTVIQQRWFIEEAARVLEPGGILVCSCNNKLSLRATAHRVLRRGRAKAVYYERSYPSLRTDLRDAGFQIVEQRGCCWIPFSRASDSRLIPQLGRLEQRLGLHHLPSISPWVVLIARKV